MLTLIRRLVRPVLRPLERPTLPRPVAGGDTVHVMCCADAAYGPWLGVMLASLFRFDHGALRIHVLSDAIDAASLDRIARMAEQAGAVLSIHDVAPQLDAEPTLKLFGHVSRATYGRIFAADFLPPGVDRVIFLDVDLLCRAALRDLWTSDLGGAVAGVVPDCAVGPGADAEFAAFGRRIRDSHGVHIGLPADGTYVNTGVMLIDLARWRLENVGPAALAWMQDEAQPRQYADQDALNCVLRGRFAMLDDGWNRLSRWCKEDPGPDAKILHFAGPEKPWHADYRGIGSTEWRAVHAASPFGA